MIQDFECEFAQRLVQIFWKNKDSLKWSHRTIAGVSPQLHHVVTFSDVSRFIAFCSTFEYPVAIDQSSTRFQLSPIRFQTRRDSVPFEHVTTFDLNLDLWRSAFTDSFGPARSQTILLLLHLLTMLKTFKDPGSAAVAAGCAARGLQSIKMFAIMHPSRCFPSFVVVVMIAATIFDQRVLTTRESCVLAMVS